jgi:hypothetical protein
LDTAPRQIARERHADRTASRNDHRNMLHDEIYIARAASTLACIACGTLGVRER